LTALRRSRVFARDDYGACTVFLAGAQKNAHLELSAALRGRMQKYERVFHAKLAKFFAKGAKQLAISYQPSALRIGRIQISDPKQRKFRASIT